jgi:hypothetical protein
VIDDLTHQRCAETVADFRPRDDVRLEGRDGLFRVWFHAVREEAIEGTPLATGASAL